MHRSARFAWVAFGLVAAASTGACVDATHDAQVEALGGEAPGVSPGPFHRPGQPCLVCHGGSGPAHAQFSVAGTVYLVEGQDAPAVAAQVSMEDVRGSLFTSETNAAGNFYVTPSEWSPVAPLKGPQVTQGKNAEFMFSNVGRDGSCAGCHTDPPGPTSPGRVFVTVAPTASAEAGP
jgi:hypothetical protein